MPMYHSKTVLIFLFSIVLFEVELAQLINEQFVANLKSKGLLGAFELLNDD